MKFLVFVAVCLKVTGVLAAPATTFGSTGPEIIPIAGGDTVTEPVEGNDPANSEPVVEEPVASPPVEAPPVETPPAGSDPVEEAPGEGGEGGEGEEGEGNEVELEAAFGDTVALEGGDLKQDVLYPPSVSCLSPLGFQCESMTDH